MVVKEKRGRRRYVVFRVSPELDRDALIRRARRLQVRGWAPYIVQCSDGWAIVRCAPDEREKTAAAMSEMDPGCESLLTSGTLKSLRDRYPELREGHIRK
jgi:hypothetical protein